MALADQLLRRPVWRRGLADAGSERVEGLRRLLARRPEWWVYAVAAVAAMWLLLPVVSDAVGGAVRGGHHHSPHRHLPDGLAGHVLGGGSSPDASVGAFLADWAVGWSHWAVMVLAMMLPIAAPQAHTLATRSLWSRRHRASGVFVFAFVAVWFAVGGVAVGFAAFRGPMSSGAWVALALAAAAAWQVAPPRRRLLRRCSSLRLGQASGVGADLDCARAGIRSGLRCVCTCGPMMLAMVFSHSLMLMTALALVMVGERSRGPDPLARAGRQREAWMLLGVAVLAAGWAAVQ